MTKLLLFFSCLIALVIYHPVMGNQFIQSGLQSRYIINLDQPPETRWNEVINAYKNQTDELLAYFDQLTRHIPEPAVVLIEKIAAIFTKLAKIPEDYKREMIAFSKGYDLPLGMIVTLNYIYELRYFGPPTNVTQSAGGACTSIIAGDRNGTIWHGRNMDWNLPNSLRAMTFRCDFYRSGHHIYSGVCFPGFVGQLTTFKAARYAITLNERHLGGKPWWDLFYATFTAAWAPTHLLRNVMETQNSFHDALKVLDQAKLAAPVYFIISGNETNQGVIIERDRTSVHASRWLNHSDPTGQQPLNQTWFILVTNYDWDTQPPVRDNRRPYALRYMEELGQRNVSVAGLSSVLAKWPVKNNNTAYTTIMSADQYVFQTKIQSN